MQCFIFLWLQGCWWEVYCPPFPLSLLWSSVPELWNFMKKCFGIGLIWVIVLGTQRVFPFLKFISLDSRKLTWISSLISPPLLCSNFPEFLVSIMGPLALFFGFSYLFFTIPFTLISGEVSSSYLPNHFCYYIFN